MYAYPTKTFQNDYPKHTDFFYLALMLGSYLYYIPPRFLHC